MDIYYLAKHVGYKTPSTDYCVVVDLLTSFRVGALRCLRCSSDVQLDGRYFLVHLLVDGEVEEERRAHQRGALVLGGAARELDAVKVALCAALVGKAWRAPATLPLSSVSARPVCTPRESQSQEGRRYVLRVRADRKRGG
eukprot:1706776-Pyramimonas_sp.AAC.1